MSRPAILYGAAVLLAGWLAAGALSESQRRRVWSRIEGASRLSARPSETVPAAIRRAGARGSVVVMAVLAAAGAFFALGIIGSIVTLALMPALHRSVRRRRGARDRETMERQLRDAVGAMAAGLRAGLSTRLAVAEAARDAEPPMDEALDRVLKRLDLGEPLDIALERLLGSLHLGDAALLVNVLRIHRRTGGDLPALLDRVADVIAGRASERRQLRVMTAQAKASGAVLAALPVAFVALLSGAGGDGLGAFYGSPLGVSLLLCGILLDAAGFAWMRRIVRGVEDAT